MGRLTKYSDDTVHENGVCCTHFGSLECYKFAGNCSLGCEWEEKAWSKLAHYEDLEEKCIEETTFGFATLLRKWKEFQDDIAQWLEWRNLEEAGRLIILPEEFDKEKFIYSNCPSYILLEDHCHGDCKECWEAALKGNKNDR